MQGYTRSAEIRLFFLLLTLHDPPISQIFSPGGQAYTTFYPIIHHIALPFRPPPGKTQSSLTSHTKGTPNHPSNCQSDLLPTATLYATWDKSGAKSKDCHKMLICSSPVSISSFHLPDPVLTSSSLLAHFATPPFSVLPLPPPPQDEPFAFDELPLLLQGISSLVDDQDQRSGSASSLDLDSSRESQSSESMSASDSLRQSISSTASSSLRSISQGSLTQPVSCTSIYTKDTEDETSSEIAKEVNRPSRSLHEKTHASLLDRLRPLSRTNTLSSQELKRVRQERRDRGSDASSTCSSIKLIVHREQVTTTQRIDRGDAEEYRNLASQTAAWKMMQGDCRADEVFLRHQLDTPPCSFCNVVRFSHNSFIPYTSTV